MSALFAFLLAGAVLALTVGTWPRSKVRAPLRFVEVPGVPRTLH